MEELDLVVRNRSRNLRLERQNKPSSLLFILIKKLKMNNLREICLFLRTFYTRVMVSAIKGYHTLKKISIGRSLVLMSSSWYCTHVTAHCKLFLTIRWHHSPPWEPKFISPKPQTMVFMNFKLKEKKIKRRF